MAYNPFLNISEPAAAISNEVLNPFMVTDAEQTTISGENPFACSNPFSDFGSTYEPPAADIVPMDIFGSTDPPVMTQAKQFDDLQSHDSINMFSKIENERLSKPTDLELISTTTDLSYINNETEIDRSEPSSMVHPLPPETQHLILTVTGQMEFTSCDLLDRIPPTRTPSPISMRDIHSPSPTPDLQMLDDPPSADTFDINCNKPTKPPPARPPPLSRPPPPRPAPPPPAKLHGPVSTSQPAAIPASVEMVPTEEINLFDAPAPVTTKPTKEAILSLYGTSEKKEEKPIDFLSDDLLGELPVLENKIHSSITDTIPASIKDNTMIVQEDGAVQDVGFGSNIKNDQNLISPTFSHEKQSTSVPMDCSEPYLESQTPPTSQILKNETMLTKNSIEQDKNPFENSPSRIAIDEQKQVEQNKIVLESGTFSTTQNDEFPLISETTQIESNIFKEDIHYDDFAFANVTNVENSKTNNTFTTNPSSFAADHNDIVNIEQNNHFRQESQLSNCGWEEVSGTKEQNVIHESQDAFDAFSAKFDLTSANNTNIGAWGEEVNAESSSSGFEAEAFDPFLSMGAPPPPAATPRLDHQGSQDSSEETFALFIKPKQCDTGEGVSVPVLAPPPRPQVLPESPRANPFDKAGVELQMQSQITPQMEEERRGSGGETPPTPLFDEDVSVPLEEFPRTKYAGPGWEMHLRQPNKKKITGQRFWKKIFVRLMYQGDAPVVQLLATAGDKEPFQELPLQACYSVSEIGAQQFDQFGKIFTVKLQYIFYKERPGVRPGQVTKAERITNKLSQFAAYAIQGDYQGVKEFGSDLRKLGLPVEHAPQVSQLFKLGSLSYEDMKQLSCSIEEALFRLPAHRDRALTYKMEEVQVTAVDELYVEQDAEGAVLKQIARVRLFFLGFLSGMPDVELGVNDLRRQGREVVGRHDIIPVATEEWIRVEAPEFHTCVQPADFDDTQIIKFKPPDACYIELMRFRVRPPKNRELPLQLKASWCVTGNKVELRADVLVPGFASRALGQVPCEDVAIRFPIPECWIYLFRVEKHFRYGSVKSAHRRTGKIKGIERFLGAVETLQESLIEVTSGQAKYEHPHRAIVWRMPRLPKEGQGAYTSHNLVCRMALTSFDQVPPELARHAYVEFTMPATQVSHMTVRSISLQNYDSDPPEKYVRYLARHEYTVGIERTSGPAPSAYTVATSLPAAPSPPAASPAPPAAPSSDSDSD